MPWGSSKTAALAFYKPRWNEAKLLTIDGYDPVTDQQKDGGAWRLLLYYNSDKLAKTSVSQTGPSLELEADKLRESLAKEYGSPVLQQQTHFGQRTLWKGRRASVSLQYERILDEDTVAVEYSPPEEASTGL